MKTTSLYMAMVLVALPAAAGAQELAPDSEPPQSAVMPPAKPDPAVSAARVKAALESTSGVPAKEISVTTHAGTVVLTGEVNSEMQRVSAIAAAEKAAEGTRVSSNIQVRALEDRPVKDQQAAQQSLQLVRDVEAALAADKRTANLGVAVTSADGQVVVLQGLVPSRENRAAVQEVASKVKGVTRVDNRLLVP